MITYRQPFRGEYPITQRYGDKITSSFHTGIDYGCPSGTEILASADGQVVFSGWDKYGYGFCIIIKHTVNVATLYAHLSKCSVVEGTHVKRGQVIGFSGTTGTVTGPHLHFEARTNWADYKSHFNPMNLPLMSVDDSIPQPEPDSSTEQQEEILPAGKYRVACEYAFIRTWDTLIRDRILNKGERVYIYDDVIYNDSGLPFHFIGAGRCIAEYDVDGIKILEKDNGHEED